MIHFDLPKEQSSIIKVIGVGGGGSNAVNHMFSQNIEGVNFIICNTDAQAIAQSKVPNKIQLGPHLTQGLGAGANPAIGRQATEESLEEIKRILEVNTKMAFITAGMGGGTGTGGAPILAKICKDLGILTVGIVTTPFAYEGKKRIAQAEEGIMLLKNHVDTLLVISNDKLRHQFGNLKMKEAFTKADNVLATAAKCITDVINSTGQINVDFADVCTVMSNGGVAILGSATAEGENRAQQAIENALNSPLLNDNDIRGARWILININSAEGEHEFTMDEVEVIQNYLLAQAGENTDVILGLGYDNTLNTEIGITLIATGFEHKDPFAKAHDTKKVVKDEKIVVTLEMPSKDDKKTQPLQQLSLLPEENTQEVTAEIKTENTVPIAESVQTILPVQAPVETKKVDPLMPTLVEPVAEAQKEVLPLVEEKNDDETPIFFEISSAADHVTTFEFDIPTLPKPEEKPKAVVAQEAPKPAQPASTGGFLTKPSQIYVAETPQPQAVINKPAEEPAKEVQRPAIGFHMPEAEPMIEMTLVVRDEPVVKEIEKEQPKTIIATMPNVEQDQVAEQEQQEDLSRRSLDRINKLRNLSFNINAADPNNEFETVPAYLRRNVEEHNQIANIESFYSNYTVKSDENNQAEISTINSFLDSKKPD
jgi:cell division protein FtsZ